MTAFTDRELDIMSILWQQGHATVADVRHALSTQGVELAYNTVLSMLRILQDKGHVSYEVDGRAHRYLPLVKREEAGRRAVRRMMDSLFNRSPELFLTQLLRNEPLDRETLERLRSMVESELTAAAASPKASPTRNARRRTR
jgi:BlaI family transcriptional regulator, penicillinase repressor